MSEVKVPTAVAGHRLIELELPKRFGLTVLGVRRVGADGVTRIERPGPNTELGEGDIMITVAEPGASRKLLERLGE